MEIKVKLADKAAMDRSGAVAQGLSAINTYLGQNDPADYARMISNDLMGITRDDLAYDLGRQVDDSVHLFEEWGLPIWKQPGDEGKPLVEGGKPVRSGKWQIMINGESYKWIVAETLRFLARKATRMTGKFLGKGTPQAKPRKTARARLTSRSSLSPKCPKVWPISRNGLGLVDHDLGGFAQAILVAGLDGDPQQRGLPQITRHGQDGDRWVRVEEVRLDDERGARPAVGPG